MLLPLADPAKEEFLREDLYNELRWLLCAATEWHACRKLAKEPGCRQPHHLIVYTMDSALLHARSLYEFFTAASIKPDRRTWRDYSHNARQESVTYDKFIKPLHGRVMHLNRDREGYDAVKDEVVNLAADVLRLWDDFSKKSDVKPYVQSLQEYRELAVREAEAVAEQYKKFGFNCPFH